MQGSIAVIMLDVFSLDCEIIEAVTNIKTCLHVKTCYIKVVLSPWYSLADQLQLLLFKP